MLYGERWKSELARNVGVTYQTVLDWVAKPPSSNHYLWRELRRLVNSRAVSLVNLHLRMP